MQPVHSPSTGRFVISLDFELLWGIFDHCDFIRRRGYFENTREVIPQILQRFHSAGVQATWATVGMLFHQNWEEWTAYRPTAIPNYGRQDLNPFAFAERHRKELPESLVFAPDLIRQIIDCPGQELGTHTYSHYYCLEPGQTAEAFAADLAVVQRLAKDWKIEIRSLVFPRNQFNPDYLRVCADAGIHTVRTNPDRWYWRASSSGLASRVARTADAYLPGRKGAYPESKIRVEEGVVLQPASRFLRPHSSRSWLNQARLNRVLAEMKHAAREGLVYHLWWHPHNFGDEPVESMKVLEAILEQYRRLNGEFGFRGSGFGMRDEG